MSKWTDLGFECVDEGRPVFIKNGNPYAVTGPKGEERLQSLSLLSKKRKDELMLTSEAIETFEEWARNVYKAQKEASIKQNRIEKKGEKGLKTNINVPKDYTMYDRNKQLAKELGFGETQNGLLTKAARFKDNEHTLYLDFRNSIKGSFYSYPIYDDGEKYSNEQLKKMGQEDVLKYIAARDEEQTNIVPQSGVVVETRPVSISSKAPLEALKERNRDNTKLITHKVPLKQDIDYFVYRGKAVLGKEGLMKLKAEYGISTDVIIEVDDEHYKKVKAIAWYELPSGKKVQAVDYCDWNLDIEYKRLIVKKMNKGEIKETDVIFVDNVPSSLKPKAFVKLASLLLDKQEFALRTIIGKAKRRCWGELLGITTASKKELELMREQYDRIYNE